MIATAFHGIYGKTPYYKPVDYFLERIRSGHSKAAVEDIRKQLDKSRANELKNQLPAICFSGKFGPNRNDKDLIEHSGFICLDFDNVCTDTYREILSQNEYTYACWISPGGQGMKSLVKIAKGEKHREHFEAMKEVWPEVDRSGINPARLCFESYDPNIFINPAAKVFTKTLKTQKITEFDKVEDYDEIFENILKWLANRGDAFITGERNTFIYKLASALCRFGVPEHYASSLSENRFTSSDFKAKEVRSTTRSAYKANHQSYGSAVFEKEKLVERVSRSEVKLDDSIYDKSIRTKDVIFGEDVKQGALKIYHSGYEAVRSTGIGQLDEFWKLKKGEHTCLSGIGNYGKSSLLKYILLLNSVLYDTRWALFAPEDNPAEEFYHDLCEIYFGADCTPKNPKRPPEDMYEVVYNWISKRFFYVYPKELAPTPDYIKERFLELIIKENVEGCIIDPFNQLSNDYGKVGRTDKYLETFLSECNRFAQTNSQYFITVCHPHKLSKQQDGNYPCPDVFDLADGAMWNNKMDNIIIYHRPYGQTDPMNSECEFHSKKIKRQKTVGRKGFFNFNMDRRSRRFLFSSEDPLGAALNIPIGYYTFQYGADVKPVENIRKPYADNDFEDDIPF